ncbi:hypothetical protein [Microcella sp.]|uniref:hypothetical protein n=1 Tax=Microcella sp. TaxID=1913979 RepID=UPI00391986F5
MTQSPTRRFIVRHEPTQRTDATEWREFYGKQTAGIRTFLGKSDPTGELSILLLSAAVSVMEELLSPIIRPHSGYDNPWEPLSELPECISRDWERLPGIMLVLVSDHAAAFTNGYTPPETALGALAMELILNEAAFAAEMAQDTITPDGLNELRDELFDDTDHLLLYTVPRVLTEEEMESLFESTYEHTNKLNGLHPWVETER